MFKDDNTIVHFKKPTSKSQHPRRFPHLVAVWSVVFWRAQVRFGRVFSVVADFV